MGEGVVVADRDARLLVLQPRRRDGSSAEGTAERSPSAGIPCTGSTGLTGPRPTATEELPLLSRDPGRDRSITSRSTSPIPACRMVPGCSSTPGPCAMSTTRRRGGWSSFTTSPDERTSSGDWRSSTPQPGFWPRSILSNEAGPQILEIIGQRLDWDFGSFWRVDHGIHQMRCVDLWHRAGESFPSFEDATRKTTFAPGFGLPGRVWAGRDAVWISEISQDPNFPRWRVAAEEGLHSGFAAPILVRGECLGVFEFFSREHSLSPTRSCWR